MTPDENQTNNSWWETELPAIRDELMAYLRRHLPALSSDHDDLLSETFLSLTEHISRNSSTLPQSWFNNARPDRDEQSYLHKLATVILKRRIADNFRKRVGIQNQIPPTLMEHIPDPNSVEQERKVLFARILEVVHLALDEMRPEDRDLVALISQGGSFRASLGERDRQRIHRIRKKLRDEIARKLGSDVADLLGFAH